ncbi:hypothetical protein NFI96_006264 [Prochilodus magdalenae]|nr:hypothetical protein NFI96_006264 [Prochilodus magdalenae]
MTALLSCISIQSLLRYIAIVHPTSENRTIPWTIIINLLVWVGSFLLTIPVMIYAKVISKKHMNVCMMYLDGPKDMYWYTLYQSTLGFIVPLIIISTFYSLTLYHVFRSIRRVKRKQSVWAKRATKMVLMVIALFLVCWSPYHVIQVINLSIQQPTSIFIYAYNISICLSYSHSCINPLMLLIFAQNYRERLCRRRDLRSSQTTTSKTTFFISGHRTLPTGRCSQDAAHRTLPTGYCSQDAAHRTLPLEGCPQDAAHRTPPTGHRPQDIAHRTLPTGHCSGVVPDCHGVTQNGSGSSSVTSPALVLVETPNESVCGGTVVSTKMNGSSRVRLATLPAQLRPSVQYHGVNRGTLTSHTYPMDQSSIPGLPWDMEAEDPPTRVSLLTPQCWTQRLIWAPEVANWTVEVILCKFKSQTSEERIQAESLRWESSQILIL